MNSHDGRENRLRRPRDRLGVHRSAQPETVACNDYCRGTADGQMPLVMSTQPSSAGVLAARHCDHRDHFASRLSDRLLPFTTRSPAVGMLVNISPDTVFAANSPTKPIPPLPTAHAVHDRSAGKAVDIHDALAAIAPPASCRSRRYTPTLPFTTGSPALGVVVNISPDTVFAANSTARPVPPPMPFTTDQREKLSTSRCARHRVHRDRFPPDGGKTWCRISPISPADVAGDTSMRPAARLSSPHDTTANSPAKPIPAPLPFTPVRGQSGRRDDGGDLRHGDAMRKVRPSPYGVLRK
jgi:hypothetical protein